jgi:hypothetical protein
MVSNVPRDLPVPPDQHSDREMRNTAYAVEWHVFVQQKQGNAAGKLLS